jgi:4-aminobutyrate aminotransferase-like enzyme
VRAGVQRLAARGHSPALLLVDPMFTSEGIIEPADGFLTALGDSARAAGALVLADEVQSGFGRCGQMWSFAREGLVPDLVTLGKPMGNGYPVSAVLTRSDIAASLGPGVQYFSTFAGGPVAAAAALAVLDVLQDRAIPAQAILTGNYLREQLRSLADATGKLGEVRGHGLVAGVDVQVGPDADARRRTRQIVEGLRERHVLVGATGKNGAVLKIRPPLVWQRQQVDELVAALREVLGMPELTGDL